MPLFENSDRADRLHSFTSGDSKRVAEGVDKKISLSRGQAEWRANLKGLAVTARSSNQHMAVSQSIDQLRGQGGVWTARIIWLAEIDAKKQACAADLSNAGIIDDDLPKPSQQMSANASGVLLQTLTFDHVQDSHAGGSGQCIASECVEIANIVAEDSEQFRASHQSGHGEAVAHRFPHRDDVGNYTMSFEAPERVAGPSKARLNLVGDVKATSVSRGGDCACKEFCGIGKHSV